MARNTIPVKNNDPQVGTAVACVDRRTTSFMTATILLLHLVFLIFAFTCF